MIASKNFAFGGNSACTSVPGDAQETRDPVRSLGCGSRIATRPGPRCLDNDPLCPVFPRIRLPGEAVGKTH